MDLEFDNRVYPPRFPVRINRDKIINGSFLYHKDLSNDPHQRIIHPVYENEKTPFHFNREFRPGSKIFGIAKITEEGEIMKFHMIVSDGHENRVFTWTETDNSQHQSVSTFRDFRMIRELFMVDSENFYIQIDQLGYRMNTQEVTNKHWGEINGDTDFCTKLNVEMGRVMIICTNKHMHTFIAKDITIDGKESSNSFLIDHDLRFRKGETLKKLFTMDSKDSTIILVYEEEVPGDNPLIVIVLEYSSFEHKLMMTKKVNPAFKELPIRKIVDFVFVDEFFIFLTIDSRVRTLQFFTFMGVDKTRRIKNIPFPEQVSFTKEATLLRGKKLENANE